MVSLVSVTFAFLSLGLLAAPVAREEFQQQEEDDTFFSGTVDEFTHESVVVTREVLGNPPEHRTFVITSQTKMEGKLAEGVRVTVKFRVTDDGFTADAIIVRELLKPKKKP